MTSISLILTPTQITVAADSASTINGIKVSTDHDKISMISNNPPMGIVVSGAAEFSNMPLSIIINKVINNTDFHKVNKHDTIANEFLKTIEESVEDMNIDNYLDEFKEFVTSNLLKLSRTQIEETLKYTREKSMIKFIEKNNEFDKKFEEIRKEFKEFEDKPSLINLKKYFTYFLKSKGSHIVIFGINEGDDYGSFVTMNIYFKYNNELYYEIEENEINFDGTLIRLYAQKDGGDTFLTGISKDMMKSIPQELNKILEDNSEILNNILSQINPNTNMILKEQLKDYNDNLINELTNKINNLAYKNLEEPSKYIQSLSKKDLSLLAETLVLNTMMKRKLTPYAETVSGDIDIAMINKNDGFIWMAKKNYFDPEKNPQYYMRNK